MRDKQVKIEIDGNLIDIDDFLRGADKKYILEPNVYEIKKQILTDIRDYLVERKSVLEGASNHLNKVVFYHYVQLLDDLTEYAEKLGVEL
jgi:hypothetical protein